MDDVAEGSAPTEGEPPVAARAVASTTRSLARAGIIVTAAFAVSRVLGYLRYIVIAAAVPDAAQLDAFFAAFRIPDFLFQLVAAGALSSAMIPVVAGLFATDAHARAWRVVSTVTTLMLGVLALLALLVLVFAPALVAFITPGFDDAQLEMTVELTRVMVLAPLFLAAGAVATSVLNASGRFGAAALAPVVYNVAIIIGALLFVPLFGVVGLAIGVVAGSLGHLLVQVPVLGRIGARIRPRMDLADTEARHTLALMAPRALGLGAVQVVFLVMTSLASTLSTGAIAAFTFAFAVLQIPIGVIGVPLGVVLLPSLSREAATGDGAAFRSLLLRALRLLAFVMVPIATIGFVVAGDVTQLLFDYGATDQALLDTTSVALQAFLLGVTAHSLIAVLARAFYARQDTLTPVLAALVAVAVDIAAAVVLVGPYGVVGLAAAIAIGAWVETVLLAVLLRRHVPGLALGSVARVLLVTSVIALAGAAVAFVVRQALVGLSGEDPSQLVVLAQLVVTTAAGALVVVAAAAALRMEELRTIVGVMADLMRRRGRP